MLKYSIRMSDNGTRSIWMPRLARLGANWLLGIAWVARFSGSRSMKSYSPLRKDSQRGCGSSMIEISTRSTIGSLRPFILARMAWAGASLSAGCAL